MTAADSEIERQVDMIRAVNRLIAAAVVHRNAVVIGEPLGEQQPFLDAVQNYLELRTGLDAARDRFLSVFPDADALVDHLQPRDAAGR